MSRSIVSWSLLLICCFCTDKVWSAAINHDTDPEKKNKIASDGKPHPGIQQKRKFHFDRLVSLVETPKVDFNLDHLVALTTPEVDQTRAQIEATFKKVEEEDRYVEKLDEKSLLNLPVGIKTSLGFLDYTILIDSIVMLPAGSLLYASMQFEIPGTNRKIHFQGRDIKFSMEGGISAEGKLALVGDYKIKLDSNNVFVVRGAEHKTFVEFDCRGYKQLSLDASLVVSNRIIIPEIEGKPDETRNIEIDFLTTIVDFNDILVTVNVPKFQVRGLKDVTFAISDAVLDFSDERNPVSILFPDGYSEASPLVTETNFNLWRGVYLKELTVTLPPQFENKTSSSGTTAPSHRVSFAATNLILDRVGISGRISALNLIPIDKGRIAKWEFSLDEIHIDLAANEVREGGLSGRLNIPVGKSPSQCPDTKADSLSSLSYRAIIKPGNEYLFNVSNKEAITFNLWQASVKLNPSSFVEILVDNGKFKPRAVLSGEMTISASLKDEKCAKPTNDQAKNIKVTRLLFEELTIQSVKPYVKIGMFSLGTEGGDSGMGGFPISIKEVYGSSNEDGIRLGMKVVVSLVGDNGGAFGAEGKFAIIGKPVESEHSLSYEFAGIEIERFGLNVTKGPFKFNGVLNFYKEDPIYGNGISGNVSATFGELTLEASAIFGRRDSLRYWYVDALVAFKQGIMMFPSLAFYSFGGGAYYHMKIGDLSNGSPLGQTNSGVVYVPDGSVGFGFKATAGIGAYPEPQSFNADITYEMAFHSGGGVKYINLRGNGYFMTPPCDQSVSALKEKTVNLAKYCRENGVNGGNLNEGNATASVNAIHGSPEEAGAKAQVWASANINYDFDNRTLHGNLKAYINVSNGLIKGAGPGNLAGEAVLHFAPGEWYIYIGRPEYENRFAIEVAGLARLDAYFVIGSVIPDSPPPPPQISAILGGVDLNYMDDLNALADGAGVGFGASFTIDTGDKTFLIFYGRFSAGVGFDIMLKDYGDARCEGSGPLGINGWYANAQVYAFFEGSIGIKIEVWGKKLRYPILDIGAAVVAQAKLPNPTWIRGIAGGYYSILGGAVKGRCKFEIEIGKECKLIDAEQESILETLDILAQTTPMDNATAVDVFTLPQAVFNYEINKVYEIVDLNDNVIKFKINLDQLKLVNNSSIVSTTLAWNDDHTVAALTPSEILPSTTKLKLELVASFMEFKNGVWTIATSDGIKLTKTYITNFTTGFAPDYIPENNVQYCYPVANQYNLYKAEHAEGYYKLKQGQAYLFEKAGNWKNVIRFKANGGVDVEAPFSYDREQKQIRFGIPQTLENNKIYALGILSVPQEVNQRIDANIETTTTVAAISADVTVEMKNKSATSTLAGEKEIALYSANFRTSHFDTFETKIKSLSPSAGWRNPIVSGVHAIGSNIGGREPISHEELYGGMKNGPLVTLEADLPSVPWFNNLVFPLVYEGYPILGRFTIRSTNRDPLVLGIIPSKAVFLYQYPDQFKLTEDNVVSGDVPLTARVGRIDYYLAYYMYLDFLDLSSQAANYIYQNGVVTPRIERLLNGQFPVISGGDYWVNIRYQLPGTSTISSTYRHRITNPIR